MIFDVTGQELYSVYRHNGASLSQAYDINGSHVYPDLLTVMTFNAQDFNGINSQQNMLSAIFGLYNADIIGVQEFCTNGVIPTAAANTLTAYPYKQLTNHKNYNAVASKVALSDWTIADYQTQDPYDISEWSETRTYMKGYLTFNNKRIAIINTHLCVHNAEPRYAQAAELFALAENEDYCIITGDFNSNTQPLTAETDDYIYQYKPFVDAGYKLANNSPTAGFTNTHSSATSVPSLADLTSSLDSIIVSSNIDIVDVVFDPTKLSYQNNTKFDHIPVIATLRIN